MKKGILAVVFILILALVVYKFFGGKEENNAPKAEPIVVNTNDTVSGSIGASLVAYYQLKDAFFESDMAKTNQFAGNFIEKITSVDLLKTNADTSLIETADAFKQTLITETKNMASLSDIEKKRRSFQMVSDALFDLLRTVSYKGSKVYQQYCPMAFDNTGASWLSNSVEIQNPYFGSRMPECGEVQDSISMQ